MTENVTDTMTDTGTDNTNDNLTDLTATRPRLLIIQPGQGAESAHIPAFISDDDKNMDIVPFVGMEGSIYTLGIYIPLDLTTFFLAHIKPTISSQPNPKIWSTCTPTQGADIKRRTLELPRSTSITEEWNMDIELARANAIAVCPHWKQNLNPANDHRCPGAYVMDTVGEFLGDAKFVAATESQGHYVNRRSGEVSAVAYDFAQQADRTRLHCKEFEGSEIKENENGVGKVEWIVDGGDEEDVVMEEEGGTAMSKGVASDGEEQDKMHGGSGAPYGESRDVGCNLQA